MNILRCCRFSCGLILSCGLTRQWRRIWDCYKSRNEDDWKNWCFWWKPRKVGDVCRTSKTFFRSKRCRRQSSSANSTKFDSKQNVFIIKGFTFAWKACKQLCWQNFDEIVSTLQKHLNPKPLEVAERFRFHKRNQQEGESILSYVAKLKKLTTHCHFGSNLEETLRDRLVCWLGNQRIQKRLLTESKLKFSKAVDIAVAMEQSLEMLQKKNLLVLTNWHWTDTRIDQILAYLPL